MGYDRDLSQSIFLGAIAILSFTGNLFFFTLIVTNRTLLVTAYNTMVLSLAVTDMLTGIFMLATPTYIFRDNYSLPHPGVGARLFCYTLHNQFIVFTLGIVSLYTITLLAIERWFAVFRPLRYRKIFRAERVKLYLVLVWVVSFAANSAHLIETKYGMPLNSTEPPLCVFSSWANALTREIIGVVEFLVKFLVPVSITFISFSYLYAFDKKSPTCIMSPRTQTAIRRVTRMAAATAAVMAVCWLPNQVYYLCFKFNLVLLDTGWHKFTVILCMFNSCVNPCIFLVSNKIYRHKIETMVLKFRTFAGCVRRDRAERDQIPGISSAAVVCLKYVKYNADMTHVDFIYTANNDGLSKLIKAQL